jgi:hypothetical protein
MNPEGKRPFECPGVDGKTILIWMLKKQGVRVWIGFSPFRVTFNIMGVTKGKIFLDHICACQFLCSTELLSLQKLYCRVRKI